MVSLKRWTIIMIERLKLIINNLFQHCFEFKDSYTLHALKLQNEIVLKEGVFGIASTNMGLKDLRFIHSDDMGIYWIVPKLMSFFSLTYSQSYFAFLFFTFTLSSFLAIVSIRILFKEKITRLYATSGVIGITILLFCIRDKAMLTGTAALLIFPILVVLKKRLLFRKSIMVLLFLFSILLSIFEQCRTFAGIPVIFLILTLIFFHNIASKKEKSVLVLVIILGWVLPHLMMVNELKKKETYAVRNNIIVNKQKTHHKWFNIYIGLGYIKNNPYNLQYVDAYGLKRLKELDSDFKGWGTVKSEKLMQKEVFRIIKENPWFVMKTVLLKLLESIVTLNIIFVLAVITWFREKDWRHKLLWFCGISLSFLPSLLTMPILNYQIGFYTLVFIYSSFSIAYCYDKLRRQYMIFLKK